jgi:hypothetical protein
MNLKQSFQEIQTEEDKRVYTTITNCALYLATGGYLDEANQLLSALWTYKMPHERDTWLADNAFIMLWHAAGTQPEYIPFSLGNIDSIERYMRGYIALDRWAYKMPDRPWQELSGQDLWRKAIQTAQMVETSGSHSFPSTKDELEALAILTQMMKDGFYPSDGLALGAELAARNEQRDLAIQFCQRWAEDLAENHLNVNFAVLACNRHVAPLLLEKIISPELQLSDSFVQAYTAETLTALHRRMQTGRSLFYKDLTWAQLITEISREAIKKANGDEGEGFNIDISKSEWIGFDGADSTAIALTEKNLQITLPDDYKSFLETSNGIRPFSVTKPSLLPVEKIDRLSTVIEPYFLDIIQDLYEEDQHNILHAILISEYPDEQMVFLVPVNPNRTEWETWFYASWLPGAEKFPSFRFYIENALTQLKNY